MSDIDIAALLDKGHLDFFFLVGWCALSGCRDGLIASWVFFSFEVEFIRDPLLIVKVKTETDVVSSGWF